MHTRTVDSHNRATKYTGARSGSPQQYSQGTALHARRHTHQLHNIGGQGSLVANAKVRTIHENISVYTYIHTWIQSTDISFVHLWLSYLRIINTLHAVGHYNGPNRRPRDTAKVTFHSGTTVK